MGEFNAFINTKLFLLQSSTDDHFSSNNKLFQSVSLGAKQTNPSCPSFHAIQSLITENSLNDGVEKALKNYTRSFNKNCFYPTFANYLRFSRPSSPTSELGYGRKCRRMTQFRKYCTQTFKPTVPRCF